MREVPFPVLCIEKKRCLCLKYLLSYCTLVLGIFCQKAAFSASRAFGYLLYSTVLNAGFRSDMYTVIWYMDFWRVLESNERLTCSYYISVLHRFPERGIMVINEGNTAVHYQFHVSRQHESAVIWIRMFNPECLLKIKWNLMPHIRKRMQSCAKSIFIELEHGILKVGKRQ